MPNDSQEYAPRPGLSERWLIPAVIAIFALVAIGFAVLGILVDGAFGDASSRHTRDAKPYYEMQVRHLFKLPAEAQIVEVHTYGDFAPEGHTVTFRLPNTKKPREWMREIWRTNGYPETAWEAREEEYDVTLPDPPQGPISPERLKKFEMRGNRRLWSSDPGEYVAQASIY